MPSEPLILVYVYSCILAVGELTSLGSVYSSQDKYRPASDPRPAPATANTDGGQQHAEHRGERGRGETNNNWGMFYGHMATSLDF